MGQPALVTRDVLAVLDDAGVRCEVVETDANYTTLRFDHLALDDLAKAVANVDWDDCLSLPESAEVRAARDALHAEIGYEAAVRIILGQEEATEPDGDGWSLTERAKIALSWLATTRPSPTPDPDAPPVYVPPEGHVAPVLGRDVPDGWEGRRFTGSEGWNPAWWCRSNHPTTLFEVRRVPAPEPATEWVPLTKLVGRTIKGETVKVHAAEISTHCDPRWWALHDLAMDHRAFPDGTLNPDTAEVLVLAEGER